MSEVRKVVVKVGSSTLASPDGGLDRAFASSLASQIGRVCSDGTRVVLVTSGAIAAGVQALGMASRPADMPGLQAASSVGQVQLVSMYAALFAAEGLPVGQVLLTRNDTAHRESYLHARDTVSRLLDLGVVPVVNENDTVAVDEIKFGDNDTLAALVATMIGADLVILLTDIEGLYDADPRISREARLLEHVDDLTDQLVAAAGGAGSEIGSGGMATKVEAARVLMRAGIPMVVCDGRRPDVVVDAVAGLPVGTRFSGTESPVSARKLWIALGGRVGGEIIIDDGACDALLTRGKSLLPAGVVRVEGAFAAGDAVVLKGPDGTCVARGLAGMSSVDLDRFKGMKTTSIAQEEPGIAKTVVVHRDHLIVL